ncbi:NUDIX domain-containing protein [Luteimonas rhizosphaerae]|uniref:NUDIX domain-containing protein n=1 Tax=Luteimonas sp. 4-12 TaxID=2027406 RepID=UPI000C7CE003|nr:NUDIX hydrolase [Luteimonas sp. 4-12]
MLERVYAELASITPCDPLEQVHLRDAIDWVRSGAPLCRTEKPAIPPKHLVSYFALICDGFILLVDHRNAGRWLPTGGHVEPGEDPRATVVRELKEELGIDLARDHVHAPCMVTVTETVGATSGHTDVSLWYAITGDRHAPIEFDPVEFHDARWFSFAALPLHRCDPHLHRFVAKLECTAREERCDGGA